jgi:hypothetical protein
MRCSKLGACWSERERRCLIICEVAGSIMASMMFESRGFEELALGERKEHASGLHAA